MLLLLAREKIFKDPEILNQIKFKLGALGLDDSILENRFILITGHRRENFGTPFEEICAAIKQIAISNPFIQIIYPVHLNPMVLEPVHSILSSVDNVHLIEPLDYPSFV